jgi:branched-chain amino acid transport system ATP-binding protein
MLTINIVGLPMLVAHHVKKKFGGLVAVQDVDLTLKEGEILGLVGPNGAGKTTLLNIISGLYQPDTGTIHYKGENITGLSLNKLCKKGISKTFQHPQSFPGMQAAEAVMVSAIFGNHHKVGMKDAREEAIAHLEFVSFPKDKIEAPLSQLNLMELKRVQLARALASRPKLLLMDELTTGLNPNESGEAIGLIKKIRDDGTTIMLIEHVMRVITGVSDRIVVLDHGEKIAEGTPLDVLNDQRVIDSYLGEKYTT